MNCLETCENTKFSMPPGLDSLDERGKNLDTKLDPTTDKSYLAGLIDMNIMTPGVVCLPVCSPERAFNSWGTTAEGLGTFYLCDILHDIEGDAGTLWKHLIVWKPHREILTFGTCAFGIEATAVNVNANLNFGGQDVTGMINTAVENYDQGGKIGANGDLSCNGTVKNRPARNDGPFVHGS
ncbi:chitin-binding type 1 [Fusarium pseudocircinatum]|uniref:Chitin-binding type 1 n=1 Tax=Fusarium pseudocircinatum TaxID=56676 RepID=A0A8H5PLM7_9HYPO|nr:chitin-binding type 1 [Fusarium pseudocircinatum]